MKPKPPHKAAPSTSTTSTLQQTSSNDGQARSLGDLPLKVLTHILSLALQGSDGAHPLNLLVLSKQLHKAAECAVYGGIELENDDELLVAAEAGEGREGRVWVDQRMADKVERLTIVQRTAGSNQTAPWTDVFAPPASSSTPTPLSTASFLALLAKLPNLRHFHWAAPRLPPPQLCPALGTACKSLATFSLELPCTVPAEAAEAGLSSPVLGSASGPAAHGRWDAPELAALPLALASLRLSNLSHEGARALGAALSSFPSLENLELGGFPFVDDELLGELAQAGLRRLRRLVIREMGGTRLTDTGLSNVLSECDTLRELILDNVQGRLTKTAWIKMSPLPESLSTIKIFYSEQGPHKTWVLDHLCQSSLAALASNPGLVNLTIARKPTPTCHVIGDHAKGRHPIDPSVAPRPLPEGALKAIVAKGARWGTLDLDLFELSPEALKRILEAGTELSALKVLFGAPFKHLLNLDRSFAICHQLRQFTLSIDPAHTPELADARPRQGSMTYPLSPQTSPTSARAPLPHFTVPPASPPQSKTDKRASSSAAKEAPAPAATGEDPVSALQPATREWRRFLKKSHHLERITWGGRGSVGSWKFERTGTGALGMKIEFEPFGGRKGAVEVGGTGGEDETAGAVRRGSRGSPVRGGRRESEVSLLGTCLSGLDLSAAGVDAGQGVAVDSPEEERGRQEIEDGWGLGLNLGADAVEGLATSPRRAARKSIEKVEGWRETAGEAQLGAGPAGGVAAVAVEPFAGGLGWAEPAPVAMDMREGVRGEVTRVRGDGKGHGRGKSESPPAVRSGGKGGHRRTSTGAGVGGGKGAAVGRSGTEAGSRPAAARRTSSGGGGAGVGGSSWADAVRNEEGWQRAGRK